MSVVCTSLRRTMATTSPSLIQENLKVILDKLASGYDSAPVATRAPASPRLVAVSKTKPKEDIIAAYQAGQRHFGENYVQELVAKSNDPETLEKCPEIRWHFIGDCQLSNASKLGGRTLNLSCVETLTSVKLADKLQSLLAKRTEVVNALVQVNTSGEESKRGVTPGPEVVSLVRHVVDKCPNLTFRGLMTIGDLGNSVPRDKSSVQPDSNPDFLCLIQCRKDVAQELGVEETSLELSMGMSNDYLEAIRMGSTNIRVGSSIFGARSYPAKSPSLQQSAKSDDKVGEVTDQLKDVKVS